MSQRVVNDLLYNILLYLDDHSFRRFCIVNKFANNICIDEDFLEKRHEIHHPLRYGTMEKDDYYYGHNYRNITLPERTGDNDNYDADDDFIYWKKNDMDEEALDHELDDIEYMKSQSYKYNNKKFNYDSIF